MHLTRGRALEAAGKIDESIAAHEKALELRPGLVQAHLNLITDHSDIRVEALTLEASTEATLDQASLTLNPEEATLGT